MQNVMFDPGYGKHITILSVSLDYIYSELNSIKNFNQRKARFKLYYPKIKKMVSNNVGFCIGSLLWAVYIKSLGENIEIQGNPCIDTPYEEKEAVEELDFSISYFDNLKKDLKYFLGTDYEINSEYIRILEIYKEFLKINEGFTKTKTTTDLKLPENIIIPDKTLLDKIYQKIQEVIKTGVLIDLKEEFELILKG